MTRAEKQPIPTANLDSPANELDWVAFERKLRAANRSPQTIAGYRQALADLANHHPGRTLTELTNAEVADYFAARLERLAATTVGIRFRYLRSFYNWAVDEEIIEGKSPMARMSEPRGTDRPPPILEDDQLRALIAACSGRAFTDRRDEAIIRLFCEPGSPRVAEMAGIRMDALDMRADHVEVHGKGDRVRRVPFGAKTGQALDRYRRLRAKHPLASSPMLWLGVKRTVMTASGIAQMLERRGIQAGLGRVHPHQLRHTSAHVWADSDGSEANAMELFGWRSPEMPRRYGRSARTVRAHREARRKSLGDRL